MQKARRMKLNRLQMKPDEFEVKITILVAEISQADFDMEVEPDISSSANGGDHLPECLESTN